MSSQSIIVYIDPGQLAAQKDNNYSLYLAKKVNGAFTVIWQSMGPIATVGHSSYEYKNTFIIQVPSYQVNYGTVTGSGTALEFDSGGEAVVMNLGQTVTLDQDGIFGTPTNGGGAGVLTVDNNLEGNPTEALYDNEGNPVFVNLQSGMDIGEAYLTPIDTYQLWFDNYQATGTIIAQNASNVGVVTFEGTDTMTISYTAAGEWVAGKLPSELRIDASSDSKGVAVIVAATFTTALSVVAVAYITNRLVSKFAPDLRPSAIKVAVGSYRLELTFEKRHAWTLTDADLSAYEKAVQTALAAAKKDSNSGLSDENWTLSEPGIELQV